MRLSGVVLLTVAVAAARAEAQPSLTGPGAGPPSATPPSGEVDLRDPSRARLMSLGIPLLAMGASLVVSAQDDEVATGVGLPLFVAGAVVGPATGLWYAGHGGGKGMLARSASLGVMAMGIGSYIAGSTHDGCSTEDCRRRDDRAEQAAVVLLSAGAVGWAASWIYDIREAGRIVERKNRARNALVVPAMLSSAGGAPVPGAVLTGTF